MRLKCRSLQSGLLELFEISRILRGRYLDILENIEGRVQRYYHKREPRQLIPQLIPNDSLNSIVRSQDRCAAEPLVPSNLPSVHLF